jgi:hypothetical protein
VLQAQPANNDQLIVLTAALMKSIIGHDWPGWLLGADVVLCCAVLCCAVLCCAVLCCAGFD